MIKKVHFYHFSQAMSGDTLPRSLFSFGERKIMKRIKIWWKKLILSFFTSKVLKTAQQLQWCPGNLFFGGPSFWFSLNSFRSMCRTTLIFLPLDKAMFEQHFWYLGHAHICSRNFSTRTWKKIFVKKSTFSDFSTENFDPSKA